jgi:ATP-dependent Zn protease
MNLADRETAALVREARAQAERPLAARRAELDRLVTLLEEQETLDRGQIEAALGSAGTAVVAGR